MATYAAFIRGINVGGHNLIGMEDVRKGISSLGLENVVTYRQSGNVVFEAQGWTASEIGEGIRQKLYKLLGSEVEVFLRNSFQIRDILEANPFRYSVPETKPFITFMSDKPAVKPRLPLKSENMDVEVVLVDGKDAFSLARERDGRFGLPNPFVESRFGVSATTRTWETFKGVAEIMNQ